MALGMISESIRALSNVFAPRRRPFRSHNEREGNQYPVSLISETRLAAPGGRIFKTTGDGVLAELPGAAPALRCARMRCGIVAATAHPRGWGARPVRAEVI